MHLDWYMDSKVILDLYAKYFWYMELNRATKVYGAYADDIFVGVLLAEIKDVYKRQEVSFRMLFDRSSRTDDTTHR